jgi:hypothetical protein
MGFGVNFGKGSPTEPSIRQKVEHIELQEIIFRKGRNGSAKTGLASLSSGSF